MGDQRIKKTGRYWLWLGDHWWWVGTGFALIYCLLVFGIDVLIFHGNVPLHQIFSFDYHVLWMYLIGIFLFIMFILFTKYIIKYKEIKSRLEKEKKQSQTYLELAAAIVVVIDLNQEIVLINQKGCQILGYEEKEIIGKNWFDKFIPEKEREEIRGVFTRLISGEIKPVEYYENPIVTQYGEEKIIHWHNIILKDEKDQITSSLSFGEDITDRKKAEKELETYRLHLEKMVKERTRQLTEANIKLQKEIMDRQRMENELQKIQRLESIGILAGGIAHDFNNLLTTIIGNLSMAKMSVRAGIDISERLLEAEHACNQAKSLTMQLLTFAVGGKPIKKAASVIKLLKDTVIMSLSGSRLKCEFYLSDDLWPVEIDEGQIRQVISNLIINADQAMPDGGVIELGAENVTIGTDAALPLPDGRYIKIYLHDHGLGIPNEYLQRIFDPYFTTKKKGSGLGLAITYSIIKKHDGYITVESTLGVGTTFYVYLPVLTKEALILMEEKEERVYHGCGRILFMDDQTGIREMIGQMLTYLGYELELVKDGEEAINAYKKAIESGKGFDLVILDLTIPGGIGGYEVIKELMMIDPTVKAIVSSGYSHDPIMADYKSYGFKGVVAKPYDIKELSEIIYRILLP